MESVTPGEPTSFSLRGRPRVITLEPDGLAHWRQMHKKRDVPLAALVRDERLLADLQRAVDDANELVSRAESIRRFAVLPADFTPESGHLTPSLKLRRTAVTRDFAFMVPADLAADALVRAIRGADKALITGARLFDRYEGNQGLSLAVEVTLQPGEKSFTDAEIAEVSKKVVAAAEKLGATLRG